MLCQLCFMSHIENGTLQQEIKLSVITFTVNQLKQPIQKQNKL
jgi:hypothetical protein